MKNKEFNFNLGRVLVDSHSYEDGIYWLDLAESLGKKDTYLYYYLGKGYGGARHFEKAEESFEKAIRLCNDEGFKEEIKKALEEEQELKSKPKKSIIDLLGGK